MLFTEPVFLFLLLPAAAFLFYRIAPKYGASSGLGLLLVISLLFYMPWGWYYFLLLILSFTANFLSAYFILRLPDSKRRWRILALVLGQIYNFGTLFWFKYRFYFAGLFLGAESTKTFSVVDLAIPIGISFYTFQQAMFLVDAYHRDPSVVAYLGRMETVAGKLRGYIHHAFFVSFFPHLVIGPIVYLKEFQPQVESRYFGSVKRRNIEVGITLIALGMFKKLVLADNLALSVNPVFAASEAHTPMSLVATWLGVFGYYVQLYFDFSGYSDMALGTARVLGVRFPMNFYSPLKAVGIHDFYKRWHITLTRVIAQFLYMPLSIVGARFSARRRLPKPLTRVAAQWIPLLINFEAIALWHGARDTFVLFGLVHGTWYVLESEVRASKTWKSWRKATSERTRTYLGRALFFFPMLLTFALFRSETLSGFFYLLHQMFAVPFKISRADFAHGAFVASIGGLLFAYFVLWFMPNTMEFLRNYRPGIPTYENEMYGASSKILTWRPTWRWALVTAALFAVTLYFVGRQPPFLYMGF